MARSLVSPVRALPQAGTRPPGRPRWWAEIMLIAVCYAAYSVVRNLVPTQHVAAVRRGYELLHFETVTHLDVEYALNRFFVDHSWVAITANYYYATLHFVVTIGVLVWLYIRHPAQYAVYRWILFGATLFALVGFWLYPLAPPRMLPGFVDTVLHFGTWGLYDSSPTAAVSNQYAAMPSLHTAWSLWCAMVIIGVAKRRRLALLALCYPAATVVVIMGTANHYILDAAGGGVVLATGVVFSLVAVRITSRVTGLGLAARRESDTAKPARSRSARSQSAQAQSAQSQPAPSQSGIP